MKPYWQTQPKFKLTLEMLEKAEPNSIIHAKPGYIIHPWFNDAKLQQDGGSLMRDGRSTPVNLVIFRGGVADWCIYHSLDANLEMADFLDGQTHLLRSYESVARVGAKVHNDRIIKSIVECDDQTFARYRH